MSYTGNNRVAMLYGGPPPSRAHDLTTTTFGPLHRYARPANDNGPHIIALSGAAGSGKSTAAAHLVDKGYTLVKFAGPLKDMMRAIGLSEEHIEGILKEQPCALLQGQTPRHAMQTIGTQWGRDIIGPHFWIGLWEARALEVLDSGGRVVTDDCRFENEADAVRKLGGSVVRLLGRGGIAGAHASEQMGWAPDAVLLNTGDQNELRDAVGRMAA
jgi:hypothetical protein